MMEHYEKSNHKVSKSGVDWHIDHCLKVINNISRSLKHSDPDHYAWKFNWLRTLCFMIGDFPRGRARAPKSATAQGEITFKDLERQFKKAESNLKILPDLPHKANFNHPYFGILNRHQSIKFMRIHTYHHLKIMRDIISR